MVYRLARHAWRVIREFREAVRVRKLRVERAPNDLIAVWSPTRSGPPRGGALKCELVQRRWPREVALRLVGNDVVRFNVLYLVSSALPAAYEEYIHLARRIGAAVVWNQNGVAYPWWAGDATDVINDHLRWGLVQADHVIYQSQFCKMMSDRWLGRRDGQMSDVMYNPVSMTRFRPGSSCQVPIRLVAAGSHQSAYRVPLLCETLNAVRALGRTDATLAIWGPMSRSDEQRARDAGAIPLGEYQPGDAVYHVGSIFLHTQHNDASPSVVGEALACGLPVVGLRSGAMPELVGPCGHLVDAHMEMLAGANTPRVILQSLAARLAEAVVDVAQRGWNPQHNHDHAVTMFDESMWLKRHGALFVELIEGRKVPDTWRD